MSANTASFGAGDSPELLGARVELTGLQKRYRELKTDGGGYYSNVLFGIAFNAQLYQRQALAARIDALQTRIRWMEQDASPDYSSIERRITASGSWVRLYGASTGRWANTTKSADDVCKDISDFLLSIQRKDELAAKDERIASLEHSIKLQGLQIEDWRTRDRLVREDRDRAQRELAEVRTELGRQRYRADAAEQTLKAQHWWNRMGI